MVTSKLIGEKLNELRLKKDITQIEIANKIGVPQMTVQHWENGNSIPTIEQLIMLSDYFDITLDYIIGEKKYSEFLYAVNAEEEIDIPLDNLELTAQLIKPSKINDYVKSNLKELDIKTIYSIAGYLDSALLEDYTLIKQKENKFNEVSLIFCFLTKEQLKNVFIYEINNNDAKNIYSKLYWLDSNGVEECCQLVFKLHGLEGIKPFIHLLDKSKLYNYIMETVESKGLIDIKDIIAQLNKEDVDSYAEYITNKYGLKAITDIACFMSKEKIGILAKKEVEQLGTVNLLMVIHFMNETDIDECVEIAFKLYGIDGIKPISHWITRGGK